MRYFGDFAGTEAANVQIIYSNTLFLVTEKKLL